MEKIAITVSTRPEIIRMAPVIHELRRKSIPFYFVHTGQHYDFNMSEIFMKELGLPVPDFHFKYHGKTSAEQIAFMMLFLNKIFAQNKTNLLLVEGDTNSVIASALVAVKLNIPIGHVEAGPRAFDLNQPEETNRVLTDHLSTLLFAHSDISKDFLLAEGIQKEQIFVTGNTVVDACLKYSKLVEKDSDFSNHKKPYVLITLHRYETVEKRENLVEFLKFLRSIPKGYDIFFPVHPRTRLALERFGLIKSYHKISNLKMLPPLGYLDFLILLKNSEVIVTDSGGVLKEATVFKVPTVVFNTSWPDREGYNVFWFLAGVKHESAARLVRKMLEIGYKKKIKNKVSPFGDGTAAKQIVDISKKFIDNELKFPDRTLKLSKLELGKL